MDMLAKHHSKAQAEPYHKPKHSRLLRGRALRGENRVDLMPSIYRCKVLPSYIVYVGSLLSYKVPFKYTW
jgi:hypothetical protein